MDLDSKKKESVDEIIERQTKELNEIKEMAKKLEETLSA